MAVQVFLSCSFDAVDSGIVEYVRAICEGAGLICVNVDNASRRSPSDEARQLIHESGGVVAIATRRGTRSDAGYHMPPAVHDEIAFAYGTRKPVLMLRETDVVIDGFVNSFGTYLTFAREDIGTATLARKIVAAVVGFRSDLVGDLNSVHDAPRGYHSEETKSLMAVEQTQNGFTWLYVVTKRLRFHEAFDGVLRKRVWPGPEITSHGTTPLEWTAVVDDGSKRFELLPVVNIQTADSLDISLHVSPTPDPDDFLTFSCTVRGPDLNPLFASGNDRPAVVIGGRSFTGIFSFVPVEHTSLLKLQWRFPSAYGLSPADTQAFVASHSFFPDYLVETELARAKPTTDTFGGNLVIGIQVDTPLLRHMYGVAWMLPLRMQ